MYLPRSPRHSPLRASRLRQRRGRRPHCGRGVEGQGADASFRRHLPTHGEPMAQLVPAVPAERRKAEAADNTFVLKPPHNQRFPAAAVRAAIKAVLAERLAPTAAKDAKYSSEGTKALAEAIKGCLKGAPRRGRELDATRRQRSVGAERCFA